MKDCPFCEVKDKVFENELAQAFYDAYPVSEGHILITPKRHVASYFELTKSESAVLCGASRVAVCGSVLWYCGGAGGE